MIRVLIKKGFELVFFGAVAIASIQVQAATLNGTFFLPSGFATSDINIRIELQEVDSVGGVVNTSLDELTIAENTGSIAYSITYSAAAAGNSYVVRYFSLDNSLGKYVSEVYYSPALGNLFEFTFDSFIANNQLPANLNFTLVVGNTLSGVIFLARGLSDRQISTFPFVEFIPGSVNRFSNQFFPRAPLVLPLGATQVDFLVEGIPPIPNELLSSFSACSNCEPELFRLAVVPNFDDANQAATALPSNQNNTGVQLFHTNRQPIPNANGTNITPIISSILLFDED